MSTLPKMTPPDRPPDVPRATLQDVVLRVRDLAGAMLECMPRSAFPTLLRHAVGQLAVDDGLMAIERTLEDLSRKEGPAQGFLERAARDVRYARPHYVQYRGGLDRLGPSKDEDLELIRVEAARMALGRPFGSADRILLAVRRLRNGGGY